MYSNKKTYPELNPHNKIIKQKPFFIFLIIIYITFFMYSLQQIMSKKSETVLKTEQKLHKKCSVDYPFLIAREKEDKKIFEKKGDWTVKENARYLVFL